MPTLADTLDEYEFLDADDRYRLLIDLGRALEPMPDALKTDATLVRGCSAAVWVYPTLVDGRLHFLADSNAAITKGIIALVLLTVQDRPAAEVAAADIGDALASFDLSRQLSSNRTQGIPNMIALIKETAAEVGFERPQPVKVVVPEHQFVCRRGSQGAQTADVEEIVIEDVPG